MCGIAGVLALGGRPPERAWGEAMLAALRHRGPDGEGVHADARIVLAHARLAIIDTSEGGAQPMRSADGRRVIVQNGEVYNHAALRRELEAEGASFRSRSDTEVLLELVARRGVAGLDAVRGMFAFGLYDSASGELLLARDRLGKKPLLWVRTDEFLAFASEAQALLRLPFVRARLDRERAREFARLLYVPAPRTALAGIHRLPAAHHLTVRAGAAAPEPVRWWRLPAPDPAQRADGPWLERLDAELLEATRLRTVSDVPIGVFLSGGVDSTTVLERLHAIGHRPIRTFTIGFAGLPDERDIARDSAARFGAEHVELVVEPDLERELDAVLDHFGEPLGDSAVVTTALIAREASRHVKVILNGDGGDELFGGYPRYRFARRVDLAASLPGGLAALRALGRPGAHARTALEAYARAGAPAAARELGSVASGAQLDDLFGPAPPPAATPGRPAGGLVGALFDWDTGVYLPDDLLLKVDVASMRHALENRSPLLDHRLFEHLARLSPGRRASIIATKPLLRRLVRDRLPAAPLAARKQGFQLPLADWLRGRLRPWLEGLLLAPAATGALYRPGALRAEVERFLAGAADPLAPYRLFGLAALERWARAHDVRVDA